MWVPLGTSRFFFFVSCNSNEYSLTVEDKCLAVAAKFVKLLHSQVYELMTVGKCGCHHISTPSGPQNKTPWQGLILLLIHALPAFARNGNILLEGLYCAANDYLCIREIKQLATMMKISGNQQSVLNWRSTGLEMHTIKKKKKHSCLLIDGGPGCLDPGEITSCLAVEL